MVFDYKVEPIPEGENTEWTIYTENEGVKTRSLTIQSRHGVVYFGRRPEGFDGFVIRLPGGGGAITLPYTHTTEGELLIGALWEKRLNMSNNPVLCAIGGLLDPNESHRDAQIRETKEEAHIDASKSEEFDGPPTVLDRLYYVADISEREGTRSYRLEIPFNLLEPDTDGETESWKIKEAFLTGGFKKGNKVRFFRWQDAVKLTPDSLLRAVIAQLLAILIE